MELSCCRGDMIRFILSSLIQLIKQGKMAMFVAGLMLLSMDVCAQMMLPTVRIQGKIYGVDEYENTPYILAGARLHAQCVEDSTIFDCTEYTNAEGKLAVEMRAEEFTVKNRIHISVSYVGMETLDSIFTAVKTTRQGALGGTVYRIDLDSIVLKSKPATKEELEVISELRKMYEKGDTIIFNAMAYEMPTGSVLLELVRRMPGLFYDGSELTYNGRKIEEIKLNGDNFFAHDLSIALKNMPSEKIRSLKVYEESKDSLARNSTKHLVMDMETDKMYKDIVFLNGDLTANPSPFDWDMSAEGNAYRQKTYNASLRYERQGIPGRYFACEDLNRHRLSSSWSMSQWNGFRFDPTFEHMGMGNRSLMLEENMLPDFYSCTLNERRNNTTQWEIGSSLPMTLNGQTRKGARWDVSLGMNYRHSDDRSSEHRGTYTANPYGEGGMRGGELLPEEYLSDIRVNSLDQEVHSMGHNLSLKWKGKITKRVGNKDFGVTTTWDADDSKRRTYDRTAITYVLLEDSTQVFSRVMNRPDRKINAQIQTYYNQRFGKSHQWGAEYVLAMMDDRNEMRYYDVTDDAKATAFVAENCTDELIAIDSLSYRGKGRKWEQTLGGNLTLEWDHFRIAATTATIPVVQYISTQQDGMEKDTQTHKTLLYRASLNTRIALEENNITLGYDYRENTPRTNMLMNIKDYSDPLKVRTGATKMTRSQQHTINAKYEMNYNFTMDEQICFNQHTPSYKVIYDKVTGQHISTPTTINGNWYSMTNLHYDFRMFKQNFSLTASYQHSHFVNYMQEYGSQESTKGTTRHNRLTAQLSHSISNKWIVASSSVRYGLARMSGVSYSTRPVNGDFRLNTYLTLFLPRNFECNCDATYSLRHGHELRELNKSRFVLNACLRYLFLKRQATVEVEWKDVFRQMRNIDVSNMDYTRTEMRTFGNTSMALATFKYRFNMFGAGK